MIKIYWSNGVVETQMFETSDFIEDYLCERERVEMKKGNYIEKVVWCG